MIIKPRFFRPKMNLPYSDSLRPQKLVGSRQFRYLEYDGSRQWIENSGGAALDLLAKNFVEVDTVEEATKGF